MNKKLTFLLALIFLFLFSGSIFGQEEVKKEYWDNGKLKSESHYKDGNLDGSLEITASVENSSLMFGASYSF